MRIIYDNTYDDYDLTVSSENAAYLGTNTQNEQLAEYTNK